LLEVENLSKHFDDLAEAIVHDAFHNVSFFDGSIAELTGLHEK
jgi:hypothetical protein